MDFLQCGVYEVVEFKCTPLVPLHEVRVPAALGSYSMFPFGLPCVNRRQEGSHAFWLGRALRVQCAVGPERLEHEAREGRHAHTSRQVGS